MNELVQSSLKDMWEGKVPTCAGHIGQRRLLTAPFLTLNLAICTMLPAA